MINEQLESDRHALSAIIIIQASLTESVKNREKQTLNMKTSEIALFKNSRINAK